MFILARILSPKFPIVFGTGWKDYWLKFCFVRGKKWKEPLRLFHLWVALTLFPTFLLLPPQRGKEKKMLAVPDVGNNCQLPCIRHALVEFLPWSQGRLNRTCPNTVHSSSIWSLCGAVWSVYWLVAPRVPFHIRICFWEKAITLGVVWAGTWHTGQAELLYLIISPSWRQK